ncbi:hypothetical protein D1B31_22230 [Neobacillus notoginsengisoli]|uniref:DUF3918 domain-containing protein n=1 Tax=Neobacillus notoginsengisoli TaxID=1578198 RepID=A0A417YFG1_9BACI|nr:hypothetical protein D1B31_22230 [Neobacillus notoginsengisoli]
MEIHFFSYMFTESCKGEVFYVCIFKEGNKMDRKKMLLTTVALGAAYLMRNKESRDKLMDQMQSMGTAKKKSKPDTM